MDQHNSLEPLKAQHKGKSASAHQCLSICPNWVLINRIGGIVGDLKETLYWCRHVDGDWLLLMERCNVWPFSESFSYMQKRCLSLGMGR